MTARTATWLKDAFEHRDPSNWVDDLVDTIHNPQSTVTHDGAATFDDTVTFNGTATFTSGIELGGTQTLLWVSKKGNDNKGDGTLVRPYLTITQGLGAVTATKKEIVVLPGTYQENLTWPTRSGVRLIGLAARGAVTLDDASAGGTAVLKVKPGTADTAWIARVQDIEIDHNGTGLLLDNSTANGTWTFNSQNLSFVRSGGTSVILTKGTARPVLVEFEGHGAEIAGLVYAQINHAEDRLRFWGMKLTGGLTTSGSGALGGTAEITLANSELLHEGVAGGSANQLLSSLYSWSRTGKTLAAVDTSDLAGDHTENIV